MKYIKKESYPISKIFPHVLFLNRANSKKCKVMFDGDAINMGSQRYQLFVLKGIKCVECGLEGKYFTKERDKYGTHTTYHFNLYAWDEDKQEEVLITKDHIIPHAKGGASHLANYQTMCSRCNSKKYVMMPDEKTVRAVKNECQMKLKNYVKKYFKNHYC